MFVDLTLEELRDYRPAVAEPDDFESFWAEQLSAARERPLAAEFSLVETAVTHADVFDVSFAGHGGDPVKGWLLVPHERAGHSALVVEFIGYGGGRGDPLDWLTYSCAGHPHLIMDTRGQGGDWRASDTPDPSDGGAPSAPGFLTRGIADPRGHYFTRLFVDAARAVEAGRSHPAADGLPVVVTGGSQGGGLTLAAAHLADDVAVAMPDVPFLSHFRRATAITDKKPYGEIIEYCSVHSERIDDVFATLSYIDVVNHAKRAGMPALFSVGLIDEITPASTVFAAYNHYAGEKDIAVYPFNGHEGGVRHLKAKLRFLQEQLSS
jgi:cephalosporin-C deacetylase